MSSARTPLYIKEFAMRFLLLLMTIFSLINASTIKVGVLHSLSGTMAISEKSVVDATLFAIEEINAKGGVLGKKIEPVIKDGRSDWGVFAKEAEYLLVSENVSAVFGCWTSASRKTVKPIFEEYDGLLFYPVQYEGLESSQNIIYTGAAPNQQIVPAVKWALDNIGNRVYLVGSDYVFPRAANAIINDQIKSLKGEVLGEGYIKLGSNEVGAIVEEILLLKPDVILSTINGDTNVAFFKALRERGVTPDVIPTVSFSIAETELKQMGSDAFVGDYAAWNYFESIDSDTNKKFIAEFKKRFGEDRVVTDPMEAAYIGVHLWAKAVNKAGSTDVAQVREALKLSSFAAPEGAISVDPKSLHLWKWVRIGRVNPSGQFDIVWGTSKPIRPIPYPVYRSMQEWHMFLDELYKGWGGNWASPSSHNPRRERK